MNIRTRTQRRLMGNHGLSFKTRCLYELDVRQSRRKQQRNDLLLLSCRSDCQLTAFQIYPLPMDFGEYRVLVKKNGEFVRCIQYTGMSGTAMMDVAYDLRRKYPKEQGYTVDW
jgi:hypothetical protein